MATISNNIRWADNTAELKKNLLEGIGTIDAMKQAVDRTVASLSGQGLFGAANKVTAAISEMGGVTKLTASEQERANTLLEKAIEKYKAMGMTAPPMMVELAAATKKVEEPTSRVAAFLTDLAAQATKVATGFLSAQAVMAAGQTIWNTVVGFVKESIKAYADAEAAQVKMVAALRAQSTAAPEVIRQYNDLATQFQRTTIYSDDLINQMEALLVEVGGIMPSQMREALKASTDLASGLGIDLQSATMLVAKAAAGHTATLGRYGITVSDADLKSRGFAAVLDAINRQFGGQAQSQLDTYSGRLQVVSNAWNNVQEAVGKFIIDNPLVIAALRSISEAAQKSDTASQGLGTSLADITDWIPILDQETKDYIRTYEDYFNVVNKWVVLQDKGKAAFDKTIESWIRGRGAVADAGGGLNLFNEQVAEHERALKAAKAAAEAHAKAIHDLMEQLGGGKALASLRDLQSAWNQLTPAQRANEQSILRLVAAYEPLRAQVAPGALPASFELLEMHHGKLFEGVQKLETVTAGLKNADGIGRPIPSDVPESWSKIYDEIHKIESTFGSGKLEDLGYKFSVKDEVTASWDRLKKQVVSFADAAIAALDKVPSMLIQAFTSGDVMGALKTIGLQIAAAVLEPMEKGLAKAQKAAISLGQAGATAVGSVAGLGTTTNTIIGVGTGLAGAALAASAWGTSMAAAGVAGSIALGAATLGIGTAAVGVALLIKHWWDHKKAVQEAQKDVANYEHQIWGTLTPVQAAEAAGRTWAATVIGVRDAYLATGRSAAQAEIDVKALWDSSKLGAAATQAAIDKINQAFIEQKQDAADLDAAIQKYGFSIAELGPTMQKQKLTEQAVGLMNDFRVLTASGIDVNTVLEHMGGSINDFLNLALQTGMEVPASMKPLLEKMIEMGTLTDANGVAITDLGSTGITFSETMTQGFDRIVAKFDELINKIAATTGALNAIPAKKTIDIGYTYQPFDPPDNSRGDGNYAARGGLVTNHGIQYMAGGGNVLPFVARGTDTVPAMLTPGEHVLSVDQARALRSLTGGRGGSSGGSASSMAEFRALRATAEAQLKVTQQMQRAAERQAAEADARLGRAVRDAMQTRAGRR